MKTRGAGTSSEAAYKELTEQPGTVSEVMQAFRTFLGQNDMMAYPAMMAPRLVELHPVLKTTGSLYLHCDLPLRIVSNCCSMQCLKRELGSPTPLRKPIAL